MQNRLDQIIILVVLLFALWAGSQFGQLTGQDQIKSVSDTYTFMAVVVLIASFIATQTGIFRFRGITSTGQKLIFSAIIGGVIGLFSTTTGRALITPTLSGSIDPALSATFVIILAPFIEEYFFRGFLFPTLSALIQYGSFIGEILGALISSAIFVIFHIVAYANSPEAFFPLFLFALVMCALVKFTNDLAPALGGHFILNLLTFSGG
jgi:membrane protease YdiL (CAAX protease family)